MQCEIVESSAHRFKTVRKRDGFNAKSIVDVQQLQILDIFAVFSRNQGQGADSCNRNAVAEWKVYNAAGMVAKTRVNLVA